MYKLKEIPKIDRPRERLINFGAESLSNEELLSILLKTGTKDVSVKELASTILNKIGEINKLNEINYHILSSIPGVGSAKACTLLAVVELSKRITRKNASLNNVIIKSADIAFDYFRYIFKDQKQEYFYVIYLDNKKRVIENKLLFKGTLNQSIVHPREVFKSAFILSASSIICVHNHPSGNVEPSKEDINLTKRLSEIGILMGIKVVDHLIISDDNYFSFLENNLI